MNKKAASVFISHSSRDRKAALSLCAALETLGHRCWISSRDIRPGENFQEAIVSAIRASTIFLLTLSKAANDSEEVKKELALAGQAKLTVIPIRIEDALPNGALAYELATRQWIDFFTDWNEGVHELHGRLNVLFGIPDATPAHFEESETAEPAIESPSEIVTDQLSANEESDLVPPLSSRRKRRIAAASLVGIGLVVFIVFLVRLFPPPGTSIAFSSPEMVEVAAGSFSMGSDSTAAETPHHFVHVGRFALSKYPITRGEFAEFAKQTNYPAQGWCNVSDTLGDQTKEDASWKSPGFVQTDRDPAVCVNYEDAKAYIAWLSLQSGQSFRLPTEAEFEFAARAGTTTPYYWGDQPRIAAVSNGTAPVSASAGNAWGLYDMSGNVRQWTEDSWHENYQGAPADGIAWTFDDQEKDEDGVSKNDKKVVRGGSWLDQPALLTSTSRYFQPEEFRYNTVGFRLAKSLP